MPRILVADDNSNIHRAVALAFKETGVEVVAVGNGEAAVRKIAEIKPDLVLADIFMPVRSGYEVCEFVKQDPRFANVPVVLLIGAFDPFDEREAQRVQADAILKKPFMPPDSLMRTVADLLAQAAARVPPAAAAAPAPQAERPAVPKAASPAPAPEYMDEAPEEVAPAKAKLEWNLSEQPVAFGTLLETPGADAQDAVLTSRRDPNLGEPAFWVPKAKQQDAQDAGDETEASTGLLDEEQLGSSAGLGELSLETQTISGIAEIQPVQELRQTNAIEIPEILSPAAQSDEVPTGAVGQESSEELPELPGFNLAPPPPIAAPVATLAAEALADAARDVIRPVEEPEPASDVNDFTWAQTSYSQAQATPSQPEVIAEVAEAVAEEIVSGSEEELIEAAKPGLATLAPFLASLTSAASAREEAGEPFGLEPAAAFPNASRPEPEPDEQEFADVLNVPATPQLDPAVIEAIAQRVIERMQPKIIELVTRELLRPAVEALVQRELEKQ